MSKVKSQKSKVAHNAPGFTTIELLMVILFFGVAIGLVTIPLMDLAGRTALSEGVASLKDAIRRAETQSISGYRGAGWGVHLSDGAGCVLPATHYYLFKGADFDAASDTTDVFEVPAGAEISDVDLGGGCDIMFSRFHGTTTDVGTVTMTGLNDGATTTLIVNAYGRVSE